MSDIAVKIGKRIYARRKEVGISQVDIAERLALNKSTIARYEKGTVKKIKLPVIQAIAQILDVNPDWLVLKTDKKGCYADCIDFTKNIQLSRHEAFLILAYRNHPDMQKSVDKLLGLESDIFTSERLTAARKEKSGGTEKRVLSDSEREAIESGTFGEGF